MIAQNDFLSLQFFGGRKIFCGTLRDRSVCKALRLSCTYYWELVASTIFHPGAFLAQDFARFNLTSRPSRAGDFQVIRREPSYQPYPRGSRGFSWVGGWSCWFRVPRGISCQAPDSSTASGAVRVRVSIPPVSVRRSWVRVLSCLGFSVVIEPRCSIPYFPHSYPRTEFHTRRGLESVS